MANPTELKQTLAWQLELGASDAVIDSPVNRFDLPAKAPWMQPKVSAGAAVGAPEAVAEPAKPPARRPVRRAGKAQPDHIEDAKRLATSANTLSELRDRIGEFEHSELKQSARNLVFADGNPTARLMIVGEAPGRDEDLKGFPFVGQAGQLLDNMFAEIGLSRRATTGDSALYITNVLPWRPPGNRTPSASEISMLKPFLFRHIELAGPEFLVVMGNTACQAVLGRGGITRLRGKWFDHTGLPVLPMFHPAFLLRMPLAKRESWQDLLALKLRLNQSGN